MATNERKQVDPDMRDRWRNVAIGAGVLFGAAVAIAGAEHLRRDERSEFRSGIASIRRILKQLEKIQQDPATVIIELPENKAVTRIMSMAASAVGIPYQTPEEPLPSSDIIPIFVTGLRTWGFRGSGQLCFEQTDLMVAGKKRTASLIVGRSNSLYFYESPEPNRAQRILASHTLGRQALKEGLNIPHQQTLPPKLISTRPLN